MPKITIGGAEHDVPDALAPIITEMQATNAKLLSDSKAAIEGLNARTAEAEAKAKAEADAKTKAEIAAAAKAGDFDKANALAKAQIDGFAEAFRDEKLASEVERHPALRKTATPEERATLVADVVNGLRSSASYDLSTRSLTVAVDGKPGTPAALIDAYLAARPHLREAGVPKGSGAGSTGTPPAAGLKRGAMTVSEKGDYITKHGQVAYLALPF